MTELEPDIQIQNAMAYSQTEISSATPVSAANSTLFTAQALFSTTNRSWIAAPTCSRSD
jgi:hypothetical protein